MTNPSEYSIILFETDFSIFHSYSINVYDNTNDIESRDQLDVMCARLI